MTTDRTRPTDFDRLASTWLAEGPTELADRVLDAALSEVHSTHQRRAMRVPWRFPNMSNISSTARLVVVGAALLAGVIGGTYLFASGRPRAEQAHPSPSIAALPSGVSGWTRYTSTQYGLMFSYPSDWSVRAPATRKWLAGDAFPADDMPYADTFVSAGPGDDQIGLIVWEVPAGAGGTPDSVDGLKTWAEGFCNDVRASCTEFPQRAMRICANDTGSCRAAILVPTSTLQWAFVPNWETQELFDSSFAAVRIIVVAREDDFPAAARYGGSVELLKSVLSTMDVFGPN